ncbi:MAG: DUF4404 family protein [Kangiellaceae bacterium]
MNRLELIELQKQLDEQLSNEHPLDDYHQQKAANLSKKITQLLNKKEEDLSADEFLVHKVKQAIDDFEINHPQLTTIIGRISDLLAAAGI